MKHTGGSQPLPWSETGMFVGVSVSSPRGVRSLAHTYLVFALDPSVNGACVDSCRAARFRKLADSVPKRRLGRRPRDAEGL